MSLWLSVTKVCHSKISNTYNQTVPLDKGRLVWFFQIIIE